MKISSFTVWVRRQSGRDDPVGDVGRAARNQPDWPAHEWKEERFAAHLRGHPFRGAQKALRAAWREYELYRKVREEKS